MNSFSIRSTVALLVILFWGSALMAEETPKKIVIVHSYEKDHICGQPQHDGVLEALAAAGWTEDKNLKVESFFMDTKKTYTSPEQIEERGRLALEMIQTAKPDVVVTVDDNAARTVMIPLANQTPVVFSGMNGQPEKYNDFKHFMENRKHPGGTVTGVYEKLHASTSIKVLQAVLPEMKKVLAIVDTSPTGKAITTQLQLEFKEQPPVVPCDIVTVSSFEEFQELILTKVNEDDDISAIYSMVLSIKDAEGKTYTAPDVFRWQLANCQKPSMALNYFFAKLGLFGGAAVDFKAMGKQAGEKVARILSGTPAGDLPIEDARKYAIVFNTARAKRLEIEIPFAILGAADFVYDTIPLE